MNKFNVDDVVTYIGSDDEWNHECCKGKRKTHNKFKWKYYE